MLKMAKVQLDGRVAFLKDGILFKFLSANDAQQAQEAFCKEEKYLKYTIDASTLKITIPEAVLSKLVAEAVDGNIDILRSRFASLSEIHISRQGFSQIVVELPDVKDPGQAKAMIGKSAVLEFIRISVTRFPFLTY